MASEQIFTVLSIANLYNCRPSDVMGVDDQYTAYCFDSACAYIVTKLEAGEEPQFTHHYSSFEEMYSKYK